jgi:hypothetical protein
MTTRLGQKYDIDIETILEAKEEYMTDEYFELDLPVAPAIMVADEIVVESTDFSDHELEKVICRHLNMPEPEASRKDIFGRIK